MVFFTTVILFLFAFADHTVALKEIIIARNDATTEQSFYATQSCLEEGYLQLRTDENFLGSQISVGTTDCTVVSEHNEGETNGKLISEGNYQNKERSIVSFYSGAGASEDRSDSVIYHILDRSGSMDDDGPGCTIAQYQTQSECLNWGGVWGNQPVTSALEAAKSFLDNLDSDYDQIGVVSYSDNANLEFGASNNFEAARQAIDNINSPNGFTNIGDALALATTQLNPISGEYVKVEILLTDGKANRPEGENPTPEEYALQKAAEAEADDIIIFVIGLGEDVNQPFLEELASEINGNPLYFFAPDASDLEEIYNQIAEIIISYNINQNTWIEQ